MAKTDTASVLQDLAEKLRSANINFDFITREPLYIDKGLFDIFGVSDKDIYLDYMNTGGEETFGTELLGFIFGGFRHAAGDFEIVRPDGEGRQLRVFVNPVDYGGFQVLSCTFTDTTGLAQVLHDLVNKTELGASSFPGAIFSVKCTSDLPILYANSFFYSVFGCTKEEVQQSFGYMLSAMLHPHDVDNVYYTLEDTKTHDRALNTKARFVGKDGEVRWLSFNAIHHSDDEDGVPVCYCVMVDETETMNIMLEIENSRREIEGIANSTPGSISKFILKNREVTYVFLSSGLHNIAGYTPEDEEYYSIRAIIVPEDWESVMDSIDEQLEYSSFSVMYRIYNKDGSIRWVRQNGTLLSAEDDAYTFISVYIDITNVHQFQIDTEKEKERLRLMLEASQDILFEYVVKGDVMRLTDRRALKHGKPSDYTLPQYKKDTCVSRGFVADEFLEDYFSLISGGSPRRMEARISTPNNDEHRWHTIMSTVIYGEDGSPEEVLGVFRDIHNLKCAEIELAERNQRDPVTGLYNREYAEADIARRIEAHSAPEKGALVLVDIDGFKLVNDLMGFTYGNTMLKNLAEKLPVFFPAASTAGRIGGDEFIVYIPSVANVKEVIKAAGELRESFNDIYKTIKAKTPISLSAGIALVPDDGADYSSALRKADIALMHAKKDGANRTYAYTFAPAGTEEELYERGRQYKAIESGYVSEFTPNVLVAQVIDLLVNTKDTKTAITTILAMLGQKYEVNRAYIYELLNEENYLSKSFQWCDEETNLSIEKVWNSADAHDEKNYGEVFERNGVYFCSDPELLKEYPVIYADLKEQDIRTFLQIGFKEHGKLMGFVGFDKRAEEKLWAPEEISELFYIAQILGSFVIKLHTQSVQEADHLLSQFIVQHMGLFVYMIDAETYEIKYIQRGLADYKKNVKVGDICYRSIKNCPQPCADCPLLSMKDDNAMHYSRVLDAESGKWMDMTAAVVDIGGSEHKQVVFSCYDVTKYIEKISDIDNLTSSPTLSRFEKDAQLLIASNPDVGYSIMYLDMAKFRIINETYGYSVGNRVIIAVAKTIETFLTPKSCYGRISAEKFALLLEIHPYQIGQDYSNVMIRQFRQSVLDSLSDNINPRYISFVAGIYDVRAQQGLQEVTTMLDKAHTARKSVPASVIGSACAYYDAHMGEKDMQNTIIETRMEIALATGEFKVFLQPKVSLKTHEVIGAEALVRWIGHDGVTVYPNDFIPLFEQNGFITSLDFYIYEETFKEMRRLLDLGARLVPVSVNVSRAHLNNDSFIADIYSLVKAYDIPLEYVELELTESMFFENEERLTDIIAQLHELGFKISLDDFGSGYSSLNLLKAVEIDVLKMDKSFCTNLSAKERILIKGVVALAKSLSMEVICEGVETEEQADFLASIDCNYAQGYLYARPMPLAEFEEKYVFNDYKLN